MDEEDRYLWLCYLMFGMSLVWIVFIAGSQ